ncbi:MAG: hypothetical protein WCC60_12945 [Ilumatobacteraceae bacterium]
MSDNLSPPTVTEVPPTLAPPTRAAKLHRVDKLLMAGFAVAAIVAGVVTWQLRKSDSSDAAGAAPAGSAEELPAGDAHLGAIREEGVVMLDGNGAVTATLELPAGFSPMPKPSMGRWLVSDVDGSALAYVDLETQEAHSVELPADGLQAALATLQPGGDQLLLTSAGSPGPVVVADLAKGSVEQLGDPGGQYFSTGAAPGFLLFIEKNGESAVVVPIDDPRAGWVVPGPGVMNVQGTDTLVVLNGGDELARFRGSEQQGRSVPLTAPLVGGVLTASGAVVVDTGGGLFSVDFDAGEKASLGVLGFGLDRAVPVGADHVLAIGSDTSALVAADGSIVASYPATEDADGELQPMELVGGGTKCIVLQPGPRPRFEGAGAIVVDGQTGATLAEFDSTPNAVSPDGCTMVPIGGGGRLLVDGAVVDVGLDRFSALSPDRQRIVGSDLSSGDPEWFLVDIASTSRTPVESGSYFFATW